MKFKLVGLSLVGLILGMVFLSQTGTEDGRRVWADAPTRTPRDSHSIFFPSISKMYTITTAPLWRFGVGRVRQALSSYNQIDLANLRFGWYLDWTVSTDNAEIDAMRQLGIEYVPIVRVKQWKKFNDLNWTTWCYTCSYVTPYTYTVSPSRATIQSVATARPGMTWVIGNEIERVDWSTGQQDEILPEVYAIVYNEMYNLIKTTDPTAQVAIGGVVQSTPLRLQYLDRVWDAYQSTFSTTMPVDVWNVHAFILQEVAGSWGADIPAGITATTGIAYTTPDNKNFSLAWNNILAMRSWMNGKGQRAKPLWITEYGVNFPPDYAGFSYSEVRDSYMFPSFTYFISQTSSTLGYPADGNRLVQRWNWYSFDDDSGYWNSSVYYQNYNGNLFYSGLGAGAKGIAPLGSYWRQYVISLPSGTTKPYAPVSSFVPARSPMKVATPNPASVCADSERVRLMYYAPTTQQRVQSQDAPKFLRAEWICPTQ